MDSVYTIEMVFNFDEITIPFLSINGWAKVLGFAEDDSGFYVNKINYPLQPTTYQFEIWNNFSSLAPCLFPTFSEGDFYKLTIVRNEMGIVNCYVNCNLVCNFDDSETRLFFPKSSTGNQILFFKDYNTAGTGEASAGHVKNIKLSNFAKSVSEITAECDCFCEELTSCEMVFNSLSFSCEPDDIGVLTDTFFSHCSCDCHSIFINEIQLFGSDSTFLEDTTCDTSTAGTFYQNLQNINGCDSIVILHVLSLGSPQLLDSNIMADSGNDDGFISINITGGTPPYSYLWNNGATTFSINNLTTGTYSVTVVDQNDCEVQLDFEVDMLNAVAKIPSSSFQIYPNPISTNEKLLIKWIDTKTTYLQVELFDVSGHLIYKNTRQFDSGTSNYFLDHNLKEGIYFLKIKDNEGRSTVRKMVVLE